MKSIMTALDGSEESLKAVEHAVYWAEVLDAALRGIIVEDEARFTYFPTYSESEGKIPKAIALPEDDMIRVEHEILAEGKALREKFMNLTESRNVYSSLEILRGRVSELLVREAKSADLVVIGKKGRGGFPKSHLASPTAEAIIQDALRPVMVVPNTPSKDESVLIAFDGSQGMERLLAPSLELISAADAPVSILTVRDDPEEGERIQQSLREFLQPYGLQAEFTVKNGENNAAGVILAEARRCGASLIVMGSFSHSPLREFFFGSVTRNILAEADCPILTMT